MNMRKNVFDNIYVSNSLVWIIGTIIGVIIGLFLFQSALLRLLITVLGVAFGFITFLYYFQSIKISTVIKILLYVEVIVGFTGIMFLSINMGSFEIFPYRIILILVWLIFITQLTLKNGIIKFSHIKIKLYLFFIGLWFFYALLSTVWALDKIHAIRADIFLFIGFSIIFFMVYYFTDFDDIKKLYYLWLVILICLLPIGLWENLTGNHLIVSGLIGAPIINRFMPTTVFDNSNDFATYLAISLPFVISFIRYSKSIFYRMAGDVILLVSLYLLLETYSRANYIAVILEFIFVFIFLLKKISKLKFLILALVLSIIIFKMFPVQTQKITNTIIIQLRSINSPWSLKYGSTGVRINLIKNSLIFLQKTFGFGVGAGNAEYWMAHFSVYNTENILNPHNWWIEILVNYGIFIFVGYIIFYIKLFQKIYKSCFYLRNNNNEKMLCETILIALVGFPIASISSSSIIELRFQWVFFAFAMAFLNFYRLKKVKV